MVIPFLIGMIMPAVAFGIGDLHKLAPLGAPMTTPPIAGYTEQSKEKIDLVNLNKRLEEAVLRAIDELATSPEIDPRWLALARTNIEFGFMAMNRAIMKPQRIKLPSDK